MFIWEVELTQILSKVVISYVLQVDEIKNSCLL